MAKVKLARVLIEELKKEIVRRQRVIPKLLAMRDALDRKIAELQDLIGPPAASKKPAARKPAKRRARKAMRAARAGSLAGKLAEVFQGKKKMSLAEAIEAVQAAGYQTKSKNFATIVGNVLAQDKRFRRVRRGEYALKG
jgi:hypothetical protein